MVSVMNVFIRAWFCFLAPLNATWTSPNDSNDLIERQEENSTSTASGECFEIANGFTSAGDPCDLSTDSSDCWPRVVQEGNDSEAECSAYCAGLYPAQAANGSLSVACVFTNPGSTTLKWYSAGKGQPCTAIGKCQCDDPIITALAKELIEDILPKIEEVLEIFCDIFYTVMTTILQLALDAIPDGGELAGAAFTLATQASQIIGYVAADNETKALLQQHWINDPSNQGGSSSTKRTSLMDKVCGNEYVPPQVEHIFEIVQDVAGIVTIGRLFTNAKAFWPPPWPKGSIHAGDNHDEFWGFLGDLTGGKAKPEHGPAVKAPPKDPDPTPKPTNPDPTGAHPGLTTKPTDKPTPESTDRSAIDPTKKSTGESTPRSTGDSTAKSSVQSTTTHAAKSTNTPTLTTNTRPTDKDTGTTNTGTPTATKTSRYTSKNHCTNKNERRGQRGEGSGKKGDGNDGVLCFILHGRIFSLTRIDCEPSHVTRYLIDEMVQAPKLTTIPITCSPEATQACAHYYSAIHIGGVKSLFTCTRSWKTFRKTAQATSDWGKQHANSIWKSYTVSSYIHSASTKDVNCERDEWPPAYFLPEEPADRELPEWGQLVRWVPGAPNSAASKAWTNFCQSKDGDYGNGARVRPAKKGEDEDTIPFTDNKELLKLEDLVEPIKSSVGKNKLTTYTSRWKKATFTRAVFTLTYDFERMVKPSKDNSYLLDDNPCWPRGIVQDPGYALLTNDKWYTDDSVRPDKWPHLSPEDLNRYRKAPPQDILAKAKRIDGPLDPTYPAPNAGNKRPKHPTPNPSHQGPSKGKGRKKDPPNQRRRERLDLVNDRLVIRDDDFNVTRPLTDGDIQQNVEIINCRDRDCTKERQNPEIAADESLLFVRGAAPPPAPAVNIAVATAISHDIVQSATLGRSTPVIGISQITGSVIPSA